MGKIEEFCKTKSNEVRARFDLLTSFQQGNKSVNEWYDAVQTQVALAKHPPETAKILHRDIFWFFLKDEEFASKTINDSSIDLDKFPTSKIRQLAKKMERSKVITKHIKQVVNDLHVAQSNLMQHLHTDLPSSRHKKKKSFVKPRPPSYKNDTSDRQQASSYHNNNNYKKSFDTKNVCKNKEKCQKCGDSLHIEDFQCPAKNFQCKSCHKYGHFTSLCFQNKQAPFKSRRPKAHHLQAGTVYAHENAINGQSEDSSSDDSFCLQLKIQCPQATLKKIPTPSHLITNLAYRLKSHHTRHQYLWARLHTCTEVNIMPAREDRLVFKDPELKKLAPSTMEIGTYNTDTLKIVGSCIFYLVHLNTKKLHEVTYFAAGNDGSVLLSCTTTLVLG